ncbi:MAG TPA: ABC transporter permease [Longimicrobium sp.]
MRTLRFLLRKEFLQIFRDRAMLRLLIGVPVVQLLLLSSAATFEIRRARMYVIDNDHSEMSRGLVQRLVASGRFEVAGASPSARLADERLLDRDVAAIVRIPHHFERDLVTAGSAPAQLVFNAEDGAAAGVLRSYASRIIDRYAAEVGGAPGAARIWVSTRGWYNPEGVYTHYMVPGILVVLVTMICTAIGSMNIVREKEIGTLEQMNVTPVTRAELIASKLIPFWLIGMADLAFGLGLAKIVFGIPMRGSLLLVFGAAAIYLVAALGIGLWVSAIADTQQQAMFLSFAISMVYLLMSGLFTPLGSMPEWAQWMAQASPVKHFIVIMRAVLVKGATAWDVAVPILVLAAYAVVVLAFAVRRAGVRD